ncbi:MAG TPA: TMEM165/GDT1 family protein [Thermoanaerobaculia bacterium]|jgi:putative Ca2+/H+ antiporter (TMEM165/GDT1 family)|nr:TMEM165/GDT1 family protein [Thermoanaerobaculia bacterium]
MHPASILLVTFASVLLAEIGGDRSMYAVASLVSRFRAASVLLGVSTAYALKMLVAVLIANAIAHIDSVLLAVVSCLTWTITAWCVWRRDDEENRTSRFKHPALIAFAGIAFTEWGDPGQLTAALLTARFGTPVLVWFAATAALLTKACAALLLGLTARRFIQAAWVRFAGAAFCVINAAMSLAVAVHAA